MFLQRKPRELAARIIRLRWYQRVGCRPMYWLFSCWPILPRRLRAWLFLNMDLDA